MVSADTRSLKRLDRAMKRAPSRVFVSTRRALRDHGDWFVAHMTRTRLSGPPGVYRRTGDLARSLNSRVESSGRSLNRLRLRVFFSGKPAVYARKLEKGGVIKSNRPGGMLTIPLPDNLTPAGRSRFPSARKLIARYPKRVFFHTSKRGNRVIAYRPTTGRGKGKVLWLWILKDSVKLRPRLGFVKTFNSTAARRDRRERIAAGVRRGLRGAV